MKKILKKMSLIIISLIGILIITYLLVVNFYPSFGGNVTKELQQQYSVSTNFKDGKFINKKGVPKDPSFAEILKISRKFFFEKVKNGRPKNDLNIEKIDSANVADYTGDTRLIWYGHSSFLLQTDGKNILLDPMFGQVAAPLSFLGEKRFNTQMPLDIEKLPQIDVVVISHDHYDHLDYETIKKLNSKVAHYFVPLGVSVHLKAWGVPENKITELDWWQETTFKDIQFICTPSQHFSGRKMNNRQSTLWSSWVIKSKTNNLYFSGDSGYEKHFKIIGEKYGPFDFAMLECGQYNEMWSDIHMMPEETAQAGVDLQAKKIMPIHWAGFKLAMHSWTDPITRVSKKAKELNLPLIAPKIGEPIVVNDSTHVYKNWWKDL